MPQQKHCAQPVPSDSSTGLVPSLIRTEQVPLPSSNAYKVRVQSCISAPRSVLRNVEARRSINYSHLYITCLASHCAQMATSTASHCGRWRLLVQDSAQPREPSGPGAGRAVQQDGSM